MITQGIDEPTERYNTETVTLQDCIENYTMKNKSTVCNDGKLLGFIQEANTLDARRIYAGYHRTSTG